MAHLYHVSSEDLNVVTFFDSKIESICSQVVMERLRDTYIYIYIDTCLNAKSQFSVCCLLLHPWPEYEISFVFLVFSELTVLDLISGL